MPPHTPGSPLRQSACSNPGTDPEILRELRELPRRPAELAALTRNLIVHRNEYHRDGRTLPEDRREDPETRYVADLLALVRARNDAPLDTPRPTRHRFTGTCRDFALLLCCLLRHTGTHARVRCGFARYFVPGFHDDHWVTEYEHPDHGWVLADAQVLTGYDVPFDPLDVPREQFLTGGEAWRECRAGRADPADFGVSTLPSVTGLWFVRGSVLRDLAALNGVEVLPWDTWGLGAVPEAELTPDDLALLDAVAADSPDERRRLFADPRLRVPGEVLSHTARGVCRVSLPDRH
ncbi:transglutaminase-like domain-containing protein [Streptomyces sp. NPDC002851]